MIYIGPDYDENFGIILPGLVNKLYPRQLTDAGITELLSLFPHLSHYFSNGTNDNTGGGGFTGQWVPLGWWDITPAKVTQIVNDELDKLNVVIN